jgi:hypothetical protein
MVPIPAARAAAPLNILKNFFISNYHLSAI